MVTNLTKTKSAARKRTGANDLSNASEVVVKDAFIAKADQGTNSNRGSVKRKRIMALSFFPAFSPPASGGEMRLLNIYRELSARFDVTLLSSSHVGGAIEKVVHGPNFCEYRIPKGKGFDNDYAEIKDFSSGSDVSGLSVSSHALTNSEFHIEYLRHYPDTDIIIHDFPYTILFDSFLGLDEKPRVYASHNSEAELAKALFPAPKGLPLQKLTASLEKHLVQSVDLIAYCAPMDLKHLSTVREGGMPDTVFVPNGLTLRPLRTRQSLDEGPSALFLGSGHAPNLEAVKFIITELAPSLPEVRFHIGGTCCDPSVSAPKNVTVHGRISNAAKNDLLMSCDVALNPMKTGSGSNLKVLEYMSCGLPILSTKFGMRGIDAVDGEHVVMAECQDFAAKLRGMLKNTAATTSLGKKAYDEIAKNYAWEKLTSDFADALDRLQPKPNAFLSRPWFLTLNDYDFSTSAGGGSTRIKGLYSAVENIAPVVGLCFSENEFISKTVINENFVLFRIPKTDFHLNEEREMEGKFHISARDIVSMRNATKNSLYAAFYNCLRKGAVRIMCEHPYMVGLPREFGDRFIYSSQNHELLLKRDLLQYHPDRDLLLTTLADGERFAIEKSDLVVTCSDVDGTTMYAEVRSGAPVVTIRNGVEPPSETGDLKPSKAVGPMSAVFLGSAHMPNIGSADFLLEKVIPNHPKVEFHFVGGICSALNRDLPKNVILHGVVPEAEKSSILRASRIALNPMFSGGGSNVKMADYLAHGLPSVTTSFGIRGYPEDVINHVFVAEAEDFSDALAEALRKADSAVDRQARIDMFDSELSMKALSKAYGNVIVGMSKPKKRALFVTYRYSSPALGGAEAHMLDFISALDNTNDWEIDVASTEVTKIVSDTRFGASYQFESTISAPSNMKSVRWKRFALDQQVGVGPRVSAEKLWRSELDFEKGVSLTLLDQLGDGLLWGWYDPEKWGAQLVRRAAMDCAIAAASGKTVVIKGLAEATTYLSVTDGAGCVIDEATVEGVFELTILSSDRFIQLTSPKFADPSNDPRPLAFVITGLSIDGVVIDLKNGLRERWRKVDRDSLVKAMDKAAAGSRFQAKVRLSDVRGPFSHALEGWLEQAIPSYDLVITHNTVFRPPVKALEIATKANVPSILIPHVHIDDDFYHFPDLEEIGGLATIMAACPQYAVDHYRKKGLGNVTYLPAPVNVEERASVADIAAFRELVPAGKPFVLVLGRKSEAKGYRFIVDAVGEINKIKPLDLVMIGPDDDGLPVTGNFVTYLGPQPRDVVRGALSECALLANMSESESFGMVVIEAWSFGAAVVVNKDCLAFYDFVDHGTNGLMATPATLKDCIEQLAFNPKKAAKLAAEGKKLIETYGASAVCDRFVELCEQASDTKTKLNVTRQ